MEKSIDDILNEAMSEYNEIKDVHNPLMGNLTKVFKNYFGEEGKYYKKLVEFDYMVGDVPEQGKPNKFGQFLDMFGIMMKFYTLMGRSEDVVSYLNSNYGLNITMDARKPVMGGDTKKAERSLSEIYGDDYQKYMDDPQLLINTIVRAGVQTREDIDMAKAEIEAISAEQENLSSTTIMKLLSIRYAKESGKDIQGKIDKLDEAVDKAEFVSDTAHKFVGEN